MFDAKDVIGDAVASCVAIYQRHKRGDVIPWAVIEAAAGFDRLSSHWTQFTIRSRRDFRRLSGIVLWPVNGVGLKLLTVDEQLNKRSIDRQRRATRQLTKDIVELQSLPDGELNDHQRTVKCRKIDLAKIARRSVKYSNRVAHQLAKPTANGIPRIPKLPPVAA